MGLWVGALAEPKRIAAQVLTTNPMKVRTLGLMRERASQRTMVSSRTPQARPKARVQLRQWGWGLGGGATLDAAAVGSDEEDIRLWPLSSWLWLLKRTQLRCARPLRRRCHGR